MKQTVTLKLNYCDRCRKPLNKDGWINNHGLTVWKRKLVFRTSCGAKYDLCQDCYDELFECWNKLHPQSLHANKMCAEQTDEYKKLTEGE